MFSLLIGQKCLGHAQIRKYRTLHIHGTLSHQESKAFVFVGHVLAQTWNTHLVPGFD